MIYITGDTHGEFSGIENFIQRLNTSIKDILIILGDTGINYFVNNGDDTKASVKTKEYLSTLPITLFCVHGNHEERPYNVEGYEIQSHFGANTYVNPAYPNQIFAKDGEIYNFNGLKTIVLGGAYSVDKYYRLARGAAWFASEQPNQIIKDYVSNQLDSSNWEVDVVLSHTCPIETEPTHLFLPFISQDEVDKSTEKWLQTVADKLTFKKWYFGHFHGDWKNGKYEMLYHSIDEFSV